MFEEVVEHVLEFKAFLNDKNLGTLVADGETQRELEVFKPFIEAKAIDVYQGDMNRFGFEGILSEAAWAKEQDLWVAPHNWGSLVGFYMQLQVGRAIRISIARSTIPCRTKYCWRTATTSKTAPPRFRKSRAPASPSMNPNLLRT